ncbi:MAG: 30S ribosomal protein S8 [Thermodesulfatator sp.]|nr:MAG: 30S ribosomal protein S8 [Thermodesulfatator sp.]
MSMTDPIADMLTRIRNAVRARHEKVDIPASKLKMNIANLLKEEGFINSHRVIKDGKQGIIRITLRYHRGTPVLHNLQRISRPGRRIYADKDEIPTIRGGLGVAIISTSKGVMTDLTAKQQGIGGEVVCAVW